MADWLAVAPAAHQRHLLYRFDYTAPGAGVPPRPCNPALAQGQAISLLRHAHERPTLSCCGTAGPAAAQAGNAGSWAGPPLARPAVL